MVKRGSYLDRGWQSLISRREELALAAGVRIVSNRAVASVIRDPKVCGVVLENGEIARSSAVLVAASPRTTAELIAADPRTHIMAWARNATPIVASCLDVALTSLPRPKVVAAFGIDRPLYASVQSATAQLTPDGGALIHLMRYGGLRGSDAHTVEAELARILDLLQPGWRELLLKKRFLPNLTSLTHW